MSRPYQNPFDSSQGPTNRLQSRNISQATSPTAAGVQPTSFKTNVNRAKTKRWVEAKSYSYDGDDWGDADDYDEYGGYDEPPQPAKPTGLRQPGQAVNPQSLTDHGGGTSSEGRQQVYQHRDYGDLTAQSTGQRQQDGTRSATNPGPSGTFGRNRVNSFDRGDEKRSFSAGPLQTDSAAEDATAYPTVPMEGHQGESYPPTQFSQTGVVGSPSGISAAGFQEQQPTRQGGHVPPSLQVQTELPTYSDRSAFDQAMPPSTNSRTPMYSEQPQQIGTGSRTQSMTSSTPSIDLQNRRDFSPSALPPPLHTRASPIPQSANDDLSATKFPPRKSSLSQRSSPYVASPVTSFHGPQVSDDSTPVSATQAEALPSLRDRAGSNATKPLPFVRPSDIYKRMEEEREKERRSQESGRPSLDSIMGRSSEDDSRSAAGLPRERTLSEAPCRGPGRKSSTESINDGDGGRRLKTILDPVQERKSEYGFEGFSADDQSSAREAPSAPSRPSADITQEQNAGPDAQSRSQSGPVLPSVHRISGFGDDFMKESTHLGDEALVNRDFPISAGTLASEADHLSPRDGGVEQPLQHHPSLGFRSVVNQAFDRPEDRSVPPTPSSIAGSGVARTNSGSTTGVSPIMSRVPSAATAEAKVRAAETREAAAPAIAEEVNETGSRPTSSGRVGTPSQASQKLPPSQSVPRVSTGSLPQPFKPGHRRDLSTPSPGNSPARSPAVEAIQVLPHAEQVEMASATPVEDELGPVDWPQAGRIKGNSRSNYATRESDTASSVNVRPEKDVSNVAIIVNEAQSSFLDSRRNNALSSSRQSRPESPIATNESPTKGKVRDLADRFETGATSRRGSTASIPSKVSLSGATVQNGGDLTPPRPLTDRSGSFRPKLPGGWESYATTSGISSPGKEFKPSIENKSKPIEHARNAPEPSKDVTTPTLAETSDQGSEDEDFDITPTTVKRTLSTSHGDSFKDPNTTRDPFSAAAAAGSALAGALAAAVGMEYHKTQSESDSSSIEGKHQTSNTDEYGAARGRSMSTESGPLHPESSKAVFPAWGTDSVSATPSASPTLPPKDTLPTEQGPVQSSDYFPLTVPLKQRIGEPERASEPFTRPQMLPSLSTEFGPQDYESDRLRKEIVRSLSPRASKHDDGSRLFLNRPETDDRGLLAEPSLMGHGRESTVLPSEYESYWNGSSDEEEPYEQSSEAQGKPQQVFEPEEKSNQLRSPAIDEQNLESISARSSDLNLTFGPHRPDLLPHRFSWEQNSVETPSPEPTPLQFAQHQENSAIPSDHSPHAGQVLAPSAIGDEPSEFVTEQDGAMELQPVPLADPAATSTKELQSDTKEGHGLFDSDPSAVHDGEVKLIPGAAGTALSTSVMSGHRSDGSLHHEYLPRYEGGLEVLKPSTEKESASSSDHQPYVISDRRPDMSESPKDQHGQSDTQYHLDPNSMGPAEAFQSTSSSPVVAQPKILAFREILALKSPTERIRAYDDTREQFANIDTGLVHWISTTISELPEHVDLISMAGRFNVGSMGHRPSPSRGKQLRSGPTSTQTMQQPYYQQYLNASALPAAPGSGSALSGTPGNGSQGFSPSGPGGAGRMTGQQVQAKGKDLLHSAGVFGGKANHAAKGLFSKGKSKFRGSGGVDKDVLQRNNSRAMQPHLAVTPPPYSEPPSSKSLTIGGRPKSLFGSSFRERPFSSVLPERPSSYAHFDNFDRRPSTPPNRTFPRLGVLPSPTFDAASSNIIDRRKADSDDTSVEPSSRDDSVSASQSSSTAPMELSNPYGLENASTGQSSSRSSSPAQSNPVVVGDVPVFLERSGESQVSTQYSGNEVKETDTTDNLETPKQADFPRSFGQTDAFTSSSPVGQHEQLREQASAPESNEASRQSLLQYGSSTPSVHDEVYKIPQILSAESSITAKQQPGMAARGSSPSFGDSTQAGNWLQSKLQPPPAHGQVDSPGDNDAERSVPTYAKSVADVAQESYNQSEASTSSAPALEHPLHLQAEPVAFGNNRSSERSISPLPLVSGPAGLSAAVETNPSHFTDSATNDSELSTTYDMPRSSINVMQSSAGLPSSGRRSESPEVSPERPSEKVINESAVMDQQQPRSSQMQQAPPLNQSRAPAQSQPRPFSFIQYSAGQSEVPAQDYMPAEQLTESGYENAQILADHGRPSSDRRLEQLISRDTTNQYNSLSTREDEKSRNVPTGHEEYTSVNQHHRSLLRSSQDPNIMELPVYHQHQPPLAQDLPSHYYPAETRRQEGFLPRQQGTEYQLTGVGPPRPEQVNNKSRRSSRGSSFLRRISGGSSSRPEIPTVASTGQRTNPDVTINSTETRKKMSKRASLFRAFDQNGGSESDRSKESMVAHAPGSRTDLLQRSGPITPKALEVATSGEHNPKIKGNKKMQDKLQRFSMSGTAEADTGKKKRFSFLRNFFTRSGSTGNSRKAPASALSARQAQMTQRSAPSQSAPPRSQNRSAYFDHASQLNPPPEPPAFQNQVLGEPPPLGGYYAPVGGRLPSTTFVGGRRLSEQQVGEAKHGFESQSGFRGPYHGSSASSRTPNLRYQDTPFPHNHPAGTPYASQYDIPSIPSIPAVYRRDYSEQEAGSGARAYGSAQTTADDTQQPPYNHWTEQPDPRRIDSFGSPGVQLPPQNPRPDLPSQYSMSSAQPISPVLTPQYTYPDIWEQAYQNTHTRPYRLEQVAQPTTWTSNMPANGTPAPRPHHNFSRHHQVYPTNQIREYTPQYRLPQANVPSSTDPATEGLPPPPPPKSPTSRPLGTRTTSIPQHVAVSPSPPNPPVPPKDDRPLLPPGHHESEILNPPSQPFHPNGDTYPHQTTKPYAQDPQRDFGSPSGHMPELPASRSPREEEEEEIVMSSTSYPGQEWSPSGLGHWDED